MDAQALVADLGCSDPHRDCRRIFRSFGAASAPVRAWSRHLVDPMSLDQESEKTLGQLDRDLASRSVITLFDHHYAFDAWPAAITLDRRLRNLERALVPYAAHLDLGVDPRGRRSLRYALRTRLFHATMKRLRRGFPGLEVVPVVRSFERDNPRLRTRLRGRERACNLHYARRLRACFGAAAGSLILISPMGGLAMPGRPWLSPQVFRALRPGLSQASVYAIGAYPKRRRGATLQRDSWPLLTPHRVVASGRLDLRDLDLDEGSERVGQAILELRSRAGFQAPAVNLLAEK